MKMERRQSPRETCDNRLSVALDNRQIDADMKNISNGGALLQVLEKDSGKITSADTGQIISFRLSRNKANINYVGTINRYVEANNNKYLAVYFDRQATEEFA